VFIRIVLGCLIYYLYLLRVNPFCVFNLNSSDSISETLALDTNLSNYGRTLYLLPFHSDLHPLSSLDLYLFVTDPLFPSNDHFLYRTLYLILHTLIRDINLFIQLRLLCNHFRVLNLMEVSGMLPLKPCTLALRALHLQSLEYITEVTLDLGPILTAHILLQEIHRFDTPATTCLLEGLNRWAQIQVIHDKGVRVRGSQEDQDRLLAWRFY